MSQFKWFKSLRSPGAWPTYLRAILFWNPVITAGFCAIYDGFGRGFLRDWSESLFIATLVANFCSGTVILARRRKWLSRENPFANTLVGIIATVPGLYLAFLADAWIHRRLGLAWQPPAVQAYRSSLVIGFMISGIFFLRRTRRLALERAQQAERGRLQAQVSALTAQMNPHLLFNSLNTIASLVHSDPHLAENTIIRLAELYRGVLESTRRSSHSLAEELELTRAYLEIEKARFGDRLRSEFVISPGLNPANLAVPVLSVQPLIENAVKHGLAPRAAGGLVRVTVSSPSPSQIEIAVEDDGVGIAPATEPRESGGEAFVAREHGAAERNERAHRADRDPRVQPRGTGTGIANCRERLALAYGDLGSLTLEARLGGGTICAIRLPAGVVSSESGEATASSSTSASTIAALRNRPKSPRKKEVIT